jgi:hypothetical protein
MAFLAPVIASASASTLIGTGLAVASAYASIKQGNLRKKGYDASARYKELEGRIEAVKAKEQGNKALENTRKVLATINATARAGGLEPNIGTPVDIGQYYALNPGFSDFFTAKDNASLALSSAKAQADDLRQAGKEAKNQGYISALGTLSMASLNLSGIGGPPATAPKPTFYGNTFNRAF